MDPIHSLLLITDAGACPGRLTEAQRATRRLMAIDCWIGIMAWAKLRWCVLSRGRTAHNRDNKGVR